MNDLLNVNNKQVGVITLKEITELLVVEHNKPIEHNKAMKIVDKLALETSFGTLEKITTVYNSKGQTIKTYNLTKKQAIAVGAKLNNALLMKVIDRVEELETQRQPRQPLQGFHQHIQALAQGYVQVEERLNKIEKNSRLTNQQEVALTAAKNQKVYELVEAHDLKANVVHRRVWGLFKKHFSLPRYNELPNGQFQDGLSYLRNISLADLV